MAGFLEGTVNVPVAGRHSKKMVAGGVLVVGALVVVYYARKKSAAAAAPATAAAAATASDQYPPDGTSGNPSDLYSTDPATGQTYGNEAAGSGGTYGAYGTGAASGQYYDPATGAYDLSSPYGTQPPTQPYQTQGGPPFSTNSAWADWAIQEMQTLDPGIDVGALTNALGVYLNGQVPTAAQKTLIFDATEIAGNPPAAGANGYPPNVKAPAQPGHATTVQVPNLKGLTATAAVAKLESLGLVAGSEGKNGGTAKVNSQTPGAGKTVPSGSVVDLGLVQAVTTPPSGKVKVPATTGMTVVDTDAVLKKAGLRYRESSVQKPKMTYYSRGTTPGAGTMVDKGSYVTVNITTTKP